MLWQMGSQMRVRSSSAYTHTHLAQSDRRTFQNHIRHEIAFVFGQLLSAHSVPALLRVLQNSNESDMVRHEAAEALGGIATPEVLPHLMEWMTRDDAPQVVRESCQIAVDMWEVGLLHAFSLVPSVVLIFVPPSMKIRTSFSMQMASRVDLCLLLLLHDSNSSDVSKRSQNNKISRILLYSSCIGL